MHATSAQPSVGSEPLHAEILKPTWPTHPPREPDRSCSILEGPYPSASARRCSVAAVASLLTSWAQITPSGDTVSTLNLSSANKNLAAGATLSTGMAKGVAVSAPMFGTWLTGLRGDASFEQIAIKLRDLVQSTGLKVDRSQIKKLEQGRVPSWPLLLALCQVYDVPVMETVAILVASLEFQGAEKLFLRTTRTNSTQTTAADVTDMLSSSGFPTHQSDKGVVVENKAAHRPAGGSPETNNPLWAAMRLRELTDDLSDLARYFVSINAGGTDSRGVQNAPARADGAHRVRRQTARRKRDAS
jgi:transcriptional regulator with XRE-family HTH domain